MPRTHDQKPRNKHRRTKGADPLPTYDPVVRLEQRRRLRRASADAAATEKAIRAVLAFDGRKWKHYVDASRGESQRINEMAMARRASDAFDPMRRAA